MPPQPHAGGSFAPPLSDETLAAYRAAVDALPAGPVKDACSTLLHCCGVWWDLPEPTHGGNGTHPSGVGALVPLHPDHAAALDPHLPWDHELEGMKALFGDLPTGTEGHTVDEDGRRRSRVVDPAAKATRDMAHHLLWHAIELSIGREPITHDKLGV